MRISKIKIIALAFLAALVSSCAEEESVTLSNDCYISSVSLGQSRRAVTVKASDGSDSTVYVTFAASEYPLRINQLSSTISNSIALPHGTITRAMLADITASGAVAWKNQKTSTEWKTWNESDSIDFSSDVTLRVWAANASAWRDYTLTLEVESRPADTLLWEKEGAAVPWAENSGISAASVCGDTLWVMTSEGAQARLWAYSPDGEWSETAMPAQAGEWTMAADGQRLWVAAEGTLYSREDGRWTAADGVTAGGEIPLGGYDGRLWTVNGNGFALRFNGTVTAESVADAWPQNSGEIRWTGAVPQGGSPVAVCTPEGQADFATVWTRSEWNSSAEWWIVGRGENGFGLPGTGHISLCCHKSVILAATDGGGSYSLRVSRDGGLTWKCENAAVLPQEAAVSSNAIGLAAGEDILWCISSDGLWAGYGGF